MGHLEFFMQTNMRLFRKIKLNFSKSIWTRPKNLEFPKVWKEFDGKKEIGGKVPHFWIQDVQKSQEKDIIKLVINNFCREEPHDRFSKVYEKPEYLSKMATTYQDILENRVSLVCMTTDCNGNPTIAGFNCLEILSQADLKETMGTRPQLEGLLQYLLGGRTPYAYFGAEKYLRDRGMYILPEYRRQGICVSMLNIWSTLCRAMNVHYGIALVTSRHSQKAIKSTDLKEICTVEYEKLRKVDIAYAPLGIEENKHIQIYGVFV